MMLGRPTRRGGHFCLILAAALAVLAAASPCFAAARDGREGLTGLQAEARSGLPEEVLRGIEPRIARLARAGSPTLQRERLGGKAAPESLRAVVLLCDFADSLLYGRHGQVPGDFPPPRQSDFYYAAHDSMYFDHFMTDVADYFSAVSHGRFTLHFEVVGQVANLPWPMAYYGNHPERGEQPIQLAADVVGLLDPVVDFSRYDTVILIHAGAGEETDLLGDSPEQIYSTYLSPDDFADATADSLLSTPFLATADLDENGRPVTITHVLVLPETEFQDPIGGFGGYFGALGVYCFEVGLRLGMLSLSDFTPAGRPDSQGVGQFCLMGYGLFVGAGYIPSQPCAFNRMLMGWVEPFAIEPVEAGFHALAPISIAGGDSLLARVEIGGREYWLLEYRLQDPDGNGIFSFADDKNGNGIPDFYDADSANGDGTPTGFFDPATDERERLIGAEWDFFMSENRARPPGVKAAGSGLYIWHVDEGVMHESFAAGVNLFNADPRRKSVDLEEADGIQDLDSRTPSDWMLGGDDDSFRGEGNDKFGPDTNPRSDSAGGGWTGIVIDRISPVVADSALVIGDPPRDVIKYAERMSFRCWRQETGEAGGAVPTVELQLDGVDLAGSHLLAADLDGAADGALEIVIAGDQGRVFAFRADLSAYQAGDDQRETPGLLAVGLGAEGEPARWCGAPAVGDLTGDGRQEIVLTAADGLYVFRGDGTELADGDGDPLTWGRLVVLESCSQPPLLLPADGLAVDYGRGIAVVACVVEQRADQGAILRLVGGAGTDVAPPLALGSGLLASPPLPIGGLAAALRDTAGADHRLVIVAWQEAFAELALRARIPLGFAPGEMTLAAMGPGGGIVVGGTAGEAETFYLDGGGAVARRVAWPARAALLSPLAGQEGYCAGAGVFQRVSADGFSRTGWPVRPRPVVTAAPAERAPSPLTAWLDGQPVVLFQSRDGRLYLYDDAGSRLRGWPLAGPSEAAGTPLLLDLDRDGRLDLVAVGSFPRLRGRDADSGAPITQPISRLAVWSDLGADNESAPRWPMWRGNPWRAPAPGGAGGPQPGSGLLQAGTHVCYPSPLGRSPLRVRTVVQSECTVQVYVHDLSGELVAASPPTQALGGGPHEVEMALEGVASGMYLCRLVARRPGAPDEVSVVPMAVAR